MFVNFRIWLSSFALPLSQTLSLSSTKIPCCVVDHSYPGPGPPQAWRNLPCGANSQNGRRRNAALRLRRLERRGLLAVGNARFAVEHPDVVVRIHRHAADRAGHPLVGQRLRPQRIRPERRRRSGGRSENGGHGQRCEEGALAWSRQAPVLQIAAAGFSRPARRRNTDVRLPPMLAGLADLRRSKIRGERRSVRLQPDVRLKADATNWQ